MLVFIGPHSHIVPPGGVTLSRCQLPPSPSGRDRQDNNWKLNISGSAAPVTPTTSQHRSRIINDLLNVPHFSGYNSDSLLPIIGIFRLILQIKHQ